MSSVLETFFILFESDASEAKKENDKLNQSLDQTEKSANDATASTALFSEGAQQLSSASKSAAASLAGLSKQQAVEVSQIDNLRALSKEVSDLSETDAIQLGSKLGLDQKTIQTLRKGESGVKDLASSLQDVEGPADQAVKKFTEMGKSALGAVAGVFALGTMISGTLSKAMQLDELGKFSRVIGENAGEINAWEEAVVRAGGSAQSFRGSIESLNEKVVDASVKGMNEVVPFFNQLGISIVDTNGKARSTLDILPELADSFEKLSKQESAGLGKKLGLDQGTILLLQSGRREVEAMVKRQKDLGVASAESVEVSEKFNDQLADLKQVMGFSAQEMITGFLPAITAILASLTTMGVWLTDNQPIVEGFFIGIGLAALKFAIPPMITLAAAVFTAVAPFVAIGLAIAAVGAGFALLYDDVTAFVNGQDSLIGSMLGSWDSVKEKIDSIIDAVKGGVSAVSDFFGFGDDEAVINAQKTINAAGSSGLASQTSSSIQNSTRTSSRSTSVNIGEVSIKTQATNAEGIASDAAGSLNRQLRSTVDNFDDGIAI